MWELFGKSVIKLLGLAIPGAIRWYYQPAKLAEHIRVRLDSEGEGLEFWAGDIPHFQGWLVVSNGTPFAVEVSGLSGKLSIGPGIGAFTSLKRLSIKAGEEQRIPIRSGLNMFELQYLKKLQKDIRSVQIDLIFQFCCKVNGFEKMYAVTTSHLRFFNFELPIGTWLQTSELLVPS
jgi:hypothetical protein